MLTLDLHQDITLKDGTFQFVQRGNGMIRLRNLATGDIVERAESELVREELLLPPLDTGAMHDFDSAAEHNQRSARALEQHILEILTGTNPMGQTPRPGYDPATTTQEQRVRLKVEELKNAHHPTSRATLMRNIKAYRQAGLSGLIDGRSKRTYTPLAMADPLLVDALAQEIAKEAFRSTGTISRIIENTTASLLKQHGADGPTLPCKSTWYSYIEALGGGRYLTQSAKTRQSAANRSDRTMSKNVETLPGAVVQVDSTPLDILVHGASGKPERPTLTTMIDVATRSVLAYTLRLTATKSVDHAQLFAKALTAGQNQPDRSAFRAQLAADRPDMTFLPWEEIKRLEASRPRVLPRNVVLDNGLDYLGDPFRLAALFAQAGQTFSPPYTPTTKPIVERSWKSINTLFVQYLPGYTGRSVEHRGLNVEKEQLLDVYTLHELIGDWFLSVWQNRKHDSLFDPKAPAVKRTPNEQFALAAALTADIAVTLSREEYIGLYPERFCRITSTGVQVDNRQYDSAELHPHRNTRSNYPRHNHKWKVKTDPFNYLTVWVEAPDKSFIECTLREAQAAWAPVAGFALTERERERAEFASLTSHHAGMSMHEPMLDPVEALPSDFDDDANDFPAFSDFNPESE